MRRLPGILLALALAALLPSLASAQEACCFPDGLCLERDPASCTALGGTPQGAGVPCLATDCVAEQGACCHASPFGTSCTEEDPRTCDDQDGGFLGLGTTCGGADCGTPRACCSTSGACTLVHAAACGLSNGTPGAPGSSCVPNPCSPTEACCLDDGTACFDLDAADCPGAGGTPQGPGSACAASPCALALVACCFADGTCADRDLAACNAELGISRGSGTACATTTCAPEQGACCVVSPFGTSCFDGGDAECATRGGTFLGLGTSCVTVSCTATQACCASDGTCADLTPTACTATGGALAGARTACATTSCPQPGEACCFFDGHCEDRTVASCTAAGATPQGAGTRCGTSACPGPLPGWVPDGGSRPGTPLRVAKGGPTDIELTWGASCSPTHSDYTVAEGVIGRWYSHVSIICATFDALRATVTPVPATAYYLVAPLTPSEDGSYGVDSLGRERPVPSPASACRTTQVLGCR